MKKNIKWFSLVIAMWLVIILSLLAFTILEYIVPFSRDIKWIENSSKAYYLANSWIEEGLYSVYTRNYSWAIDDRVEYSKSFSGVASSKYTTSSSWKILPPTWDWNSEYDPDWNIISSWNPIQLSLWNNYISDFLWFDIAFRVPDIINDWISVYSLSWTTLPIVNWQLSSATNTLNSWLQIITADKILDSNKNFNDNTIDLDWNKNWIDLDWNTVTINNFYNSNCEWTSSWCVLKFSIVNKLETDDTESKVLPNLERRIVLTNNNIPLSNTKLQASWKSYWFKKDINIKIPAPSVNEAFDFTVFQ